MYTPLEGPIMTARSIAARVRLSRTRDIYLIVAFIPPGIHLSNVCSIGGPDACVLEHQQE
jgi:hypothetical protein